MGKVRFTGSKNGPPTTEPEDPNRPDSWDDPYRFMDFDFWLNDRPGDYFKQGFDPNDNRSISTRLKDAWGAGLAMTENFKGFKLPPYMPQNMTGATQGALTLLAAGNVALGTKGWKENWSGQGNTYPQIDYALSPINQPAANQAAYQYQPTPYVPAAGANLSNSDRLRIQQENLIANRKAERLASMPAWMKDMANTPIYNQAPTQQGYPQGGGGGYYQAAPSAQQMYQAQGRYYQPAGNNPYAGRVDPSMRRGPNWERQHHKWVMLNRAARAKARG